MQCKAVFAANRLIPLPKSAFVKMTVTEAAEQAADNYIVQHSAAGDLVITRDIPLAKIIVDRGIACINDRGLSFTAENINTVLSVRNFMYKLHENGLKPDSFASLGKKEIKQFASCLDMQLARLLKP